MNPGRPYSDPQGGGFVRVRGAREHNLKDISVDVPRDALVVFTGVSGSGKSSLAFGTLYAEAQRRYLESVSPYARRLFHQLGAPDVDAIEGLPPAVALQQQRGAPTARSSVGSVTTLSNLLRMLYSRAGDYPPGQPIVYAEGFSPNTPEGACPNCHGLGRVHEVTEASMVPDPSLSIRERAIAAWPTAWGGQNQRDILVTLGYDVDRPWRQLPQEQRDWILFTEEQPVVPVYPGLTPEETKRALKRKLEPSYMGTFSSARRHVLHTFATSESAAMKKRVQQFMLSTECPVCHGRRLRREALSVTFAGMDITEFSRLPLKAVAQVLRSHAQGTPAADDRMHPEQAIARQRMAQDLQSRLEVLLDLGLGYLSLERATPTLSPGELQRLRLATQLYSHLFGVVYVLDEPSAGLHPADTEALLTALDGLKRAGNSLFVVEHDLDVVRRADWLVDVGPAAGEHGGQILYSGPPAGLRDVEASQTARYLFRDERVGDHTPRVPAGWLELRGVTRNNLQALDVRFPMGVLTSVTGVSGSGKSTLVSQVLVEALAVRLGHELPAETEDDDHAEPQSEMPATTAQLAGDVDRVSRLVRVDQKPIGRTPRSNMATYTGLFDHVRRLFAATPLAKKRKYGPGRFSFNVKGGRCEHCQGEGWVMVELLFLPSVYAPCPVCHGARYNPQTLEVEYAGQNIAGVLGMTVDAAREFFAGEPPVRRALDTLAEVGLGYLRLGQPATELSGGEAQRVKLATELQRTGRGHTVYVLDEPTTGLHPADVERLLRQLGRLVDAGHTVITVEHDLQVVAGSDWVIDLGPGAGDEGGRIVAAGPPSEVAGDKQSRTAPYLRRVLGAGAG
ncbi:excinuclease ABC subunit UvrA [Deinococcus deserti]|uniref:UvrABC system protein A n=1 Tax=Deinococcus deserti (strain DSM 17065 / CIP 109153 / LMG 22923 / VCD115) TaxID=546414 RepID=C1D386_DEIDV|nr:excinuclease ABC subunit UvrA [Deinococcus deserti]ACO47875.2 putative UvrABC system protein A (UvrA protein) [Deinococcus deserti VCD115]